MTEERFTELLGAYGADAARWPDAERAEALRYLAATPGAHALRGQARSLDAMLEAWTTGDPSQALIGRVVRSAPAAAVLRPRTVWLSGVGLAAACLMGLLVGADIGRVVTPATATVEHDGDAAVTAALDGSAEFTPTLDNEAWS